MSWKEVVQISKQLDKEKETSKLFRRSSSNFYRNRRCTKKLLSLNSSISEDEIEMCFLTFACSNIQLVGSLSQFGLSYI